jgi:hypothetical protein
MSTFAPVTSAADIRRHVRIDALRWNARRIPRSHGLHHIGYHSPGPGRPLVGYESITEQRVIASLLRMTGVHFVLSQPFTVDYRFKGRRRRYTPDLLVAASPVPGVLLRQGFGPLSIVEIKLALDPATQAIAAFRLQVVQLATGLPVFLGTPTTSSALTGEVDHAA